MRQFWTRPVVGCLALFGIVADRTTLAMADPMWVCAISDPVLGAQMEKFSIENGFIYDLTAVDILGAKGAEADRPDGKALNETLKESSKYRILEDNSVGLVAAGAEAKSYGSGNSVFVEVLMIDKRTGGFRQMSFSQQLTDPNGKQKSDRAVRGECTLIKDVGQKVGGR